MRVSRAVMTVLSMVIVAAAATLVVAATLDNGDIYLPYISLAPEPSPTPTPTATPPAGMVEFRGLWVTRFNWTSATAPASPATIDRIVDDAASAGFNAILFQVRGTADAYYDSPLEPWAQRVSGEQLGQPPDPYWDPLAHFVQRAHERGMQLHAYINVYPVWTCGAPPQHTSPEHLYHRLVSEHGMSGDRPNGLLWTTGDEISCSGYRRATPASFFVDEHLMEVAKDLVSRYDIDGLHLDHIRYGGSDTSCDPVSESRAGGDCFQVAPEGYATYGDWQRAQVNGTVARFYRTLFGDADNPGVARRPGFMLSAAVWPFYSSGYHNYYQDSKAWLAGGYVDANMPMIYGSIDQGDPSESLERWRETALDFQMANGGRFVIPGLHGSFDDFQQIADRIEAARQMGAAGHAIFAYNYLDANDYFDDLARGPYAIPAVPPTVTWHP
ncbi:MAG: glycoside hydrolase family 10 protein [bacterium]